MMDGLVVVESSAGLFDFQLVQFNLSSMCFLADVKTEPQTKLIDLEKSNNTMSYAIKLCTYV